MTLERITQGNIDYATQIQAELFPGESGRTNFEEPLVPWNSRNIHLTEQIAKQENVSADTSP